MSDWQPISTAPKDGTAFLAYRPFWLGGKAPAFFAVIAWVENKMHPSGAWTIADWNHRGYDYGPSWTFSGPAFWQPLPSPPEQSS